MAKSGVFEGDPTAAAAKATTDNLKQELQRLVKAIVEDSSSDEEHGYEFRFTECVDKATQTLQALKDLKHRSSSLFMKLDSTKSSDSCPQEFKCPLSGEIMKDPVIISTGKTYDRSSIQKWLQAGNRTCPKTQQVLSHTILTPNQLIRDLIMQWCKNHKFRPPSTEQYSEADTSNESDYDQFLSLLDKLSSSVPEQIEAASALRSLTKRNPTFREFFGETSEAITRLLAPLSRIKGDTHPELQEDLITTILNISIRDSNKKIVAESPQIMPILLDALRSGRIETRSNAAATLFTLSALDSNKSLIGKSGALKLLIDLLDEGHAVAMKDAASAIFNLCIVHENKDRVVRDGAVSVLLNKIADRVHVDELLAILAMLSSNQKAVEDMCDLGAVSCLFSLIRETTCMRNKENCVAILYAICFSDRTKWKEMREEESSYGTLSRLAENGTSRAKRKADGILNRLNRAVNRTYTA